MTYYFQWQGEQPELEGKLKARQGYSGFKLLDFKTGKGISQAKIEWHGDETLRPHPLFKEMIRFGEIYKYFIE